MTEAGHGLYCNIVTGPRHGVGRRWGSQQARGHCAGARRQASGLGARTGQASGSRLRHAGQAATARRARGGSRRPTRALDMGTGSAAGRAARPTGCVLDALGLFSTRFDSVLFLSQIFWTLFVNPVHEHCSSQFFWKFFFIKSNKIRKKKFRKIKFSKNENFENKILLKTIL